LTYFKLSDPSSTGTSAIRHLKTLHSDRSCIFQEFKNVEIMTKMILMNERGMVTLPKRMRQRIGYGETRGILVAEERPEGILLRPGSVVVVESYSPERIAEFESADAELADFALGLRKAAKKDEP
jgi:hypothetical protein